MPEMITAIYENGILRPLHPLYFRERETVHLQILPPKPQNNKSEREEILQLLVTVGLMQASQLKKSASPPPNPVSKTERQKLADILGQSPGKPLTEIVIEERGPA